MRWILLLWASALCAQQFHVEPRSPRQGQTVFVRSLEPAAAARLNGRTVRMFPQSPKGEWLGLLPVAVESPLGKQVVEFLGRDGAVLHSESIVVLDGRFRKQNVVLGKAQQELRAAPGEMESVKAFRETVSEKRLWQEPLALPVTGCMSSPFGTQRLYNGKPSGYYHSGVDQRGAAGYPVRAVAAGTVKLVRALNLHGNTVGIDHGQGLSSIYLHLSRFAVREGDTVQKGGVIGYIGSTGRSTGPHLHWGLYANGVPVTPLQWVRLRSCSAPAGKRGRIKPR